MWSDLEYKSHLFNSGSKGQNRRASSKRALHCGKFKRPILCIFERIGQKERREVYLFIYYFFYPGAVAIIVLQQRLEEARRGVVQLQRQAECGELLPAQRAHAVGVETVKKLLQALLVVVLLLAVIHPTG